MKTKFVGMIIVIAIILITMTYLFTQMSECMFPSVGTNRIPYGLDSCWELFINGHLPYSSKPEPQSLQVRFETIKSKIEKTGYDICDIRIVKNKEQCDMLDGDWDKQQKTCDSKMV